jgi:hypothetical protein
MSVRGEKYKIAFGVPDLGQSDNGANPDDCKEGATAEKSIYGRHTARMKCNVVSFKRNRNSGIVDAY